jgi:uncharacterized membrane protein
LLMSPSPGKLRLSSGRTRADIVACIASVIDALACLAFLFLQVSSMNVGRLYIASLIDPITCLIGYWVFFRRLRSVRPILADLGFCILVLGTLFLTCANAVEELGNLHSLSLKYVSAMEVDALLELLASLTLPFGLAIYAWLIATSPPLRRWLGFMIGIQVVILFIDLGAFNIPQISEFVTAVYAIILSLAKAVWFLSPVTTLKSSPIDRKQMKMSSDQKQNTGG